MANWLWDERMKEVPLFVSHTTLWQRKSPFPRAATRWALDSGGFSQLKSHGKWTISPEDYISSTRRYRDELGSLDWAAPQDWMCEPFMIEKTGLAVEEHQYRTVENYLLLRDLAPELPFVPVLQGWEVSDYLSCIRLYEEAGVDLRSQKVVGVGSVCRRQSTDEIGSLFRMLEFEGLSNLHGFGVKLAGIRKYGQHLATSDSMAWSFAARYESDKPGRTCPKKNCANCLHASLEWRQTLLKSINRSDPN